MKIPIVVKRCLLAIFFLMSASNARILAQPATGAATSEPTDPFLMFDTGGHTALVRAIVFTTDGERLISGGDDKIVRVWDWKRGVTERQIVVPAGHDHFGRIYALALSPDQKWLVVASAQRPRCKGPDCDYIQVYDFASGRLERILRGGHRYPVLSLAFSADGTRLLSAGLDETAIVWDWATGKPLHQFKGHSDNIYSATLTADDQRVVTASDDKTLRLWDAGTGQLITAMTGHESPVFRVSASPKGDLVASGGEDGELRLWDQRSGTFVRTLGRMTNRLSALAFDRSGRYVIVASVVNGSVAEDAKVWDVEASEVVTTYPMQHGVAVARIHPTEALVATGDKDGQIQVLDYRSGKRAALLRSNSNVVYSVDLAPDGAWLGWGTVFSSSDTNSHARITSRLPLPGGPWWWSRHLGPLGSVTVPTYPPGLPLSFDDANGQKLSLRARQGGPLNYDSAILDVLRDGEQQTSIVRTGTEGFRHTAFGFVPGSDTILSGGDAGHLKAFNRNGEQSGTYTGHDGTIWGLAATKNASLLASGGDDQTVRLWNLQTRELIVTLLHTSDDQWVMWTPQGYYTGSAGSGRMVGWLVTTPGGETPRLVKAAELPALRRPDLVERAIELRSATVAIDELSRREPAATRTLREKINDWLTRQSKQSLSHKD